MVFVATNFKIYIPTAIGKTMIHFGNIFCLLSGLLLAASGAGWLPGIGSAFFDVMDPLFVSSAPFTLVFKFAMGAVCGVIAHSGGSRGEKKAKNIIGALCGSVSYVILYLGKNFVEGYYLHHNPYEHRPGFPGAEGLGVPVQRGCRRHRFGAGGPIVPGRYEAGGHLPQTLPLSIIESTFT